jgi:hypothetical protein
MCGKGDDRASEPLKIAASGRLFCGFLIAKTGFLIVNKELHRPIPNCQKRLVDAVENEL